jgi:hypothetical protein
MINLQQKRVSDRYPLIFNIKTAFMTLINIPIRDILILIIAFAVIIGFWYILTKPYKGSDDQDYYDIT